jgi:hypothetical protein
MLSSRRPSPTVNLIDRRCVSGRRVVFQPADSDVYYLTRLLLRLSRLRRRQLSLLAECFLLEDTERTIQAPDGESSQGDSEPYQGPLRFPGRGAPR